MSRFLRITASGNITGTFAVEVMETPPDILGGDLYKVTGTFAVEVMETARADFSISSA